MTPQIKNKFLHLATLVKNPLADLANIQRLKKELELVDTSNWSQEDWQLYHQVFN